MSALSQHQLYKKLEPFLKIEVYAPDGGHKHPRVRIEWKTIPPLLLAQALAATMPCVACGSSIAFVRQRKTSGRGSTGRFYYAPTCPLTVSIGCSRGAAARDEYLAVRAEQGK